MRSADRRPQSLQLYRRKLLSCVVTRVVVIQVALIVVVVAFPVSAAAAFRAHRRVWTVQIALVVV